MPTILNKLLGWFTQTKKKHIMCEESTKPRICKGKFRKNNNGTIYKATKTFTKKYKWVPGIDMYSNTPKKPKQSTYYIHDNGDRPFKVYLTSAHIYIYKSEYAFERYFFSPFLKLDRKKVFIGDNPPGMTYFDSVPGNTMLIEYPPSPGTYLFIAGNIYVFKPKGEITQFYSYLGNNDVPYAYAMDDKYTYLITYKEQIENKLLTPGIDPYAQNLSRATRFPLEIFNP